MSDCAINFFLYVINFIIPIVYYWNIKSVRLSVHEYDTITHRKRLTKSEKIANKKKNKKMEVSYQKYASR